jgi:hypothetical protein
VIDPAPLPPGAVLDGPRVGGRSLNDWRDLVGASQKERDLIIKISGYHETAWGARSVVLGSDCSREEWQAGVAHAIALAPTNLHVLQAFKKPRRLEHPLFDPRAAVGSAPVAAAIKPGRLRLCPYYFVIGGRAQLSGALADQILQMQPMNLLFSLQLAGWIDLHGGADDWYYRVRSDEQNTLRQMRPDSSPDEPEA